MVISFVPWEDLGVNAFVAGLLLARRDLHGHGRRHRAAVL
jgi:hypothetical protein